MIPDEAVEAAMDQLPYQAAEFIDADTMRAALEAAAPHLRDAAFEAGYQQACDEIIASNNAVRAVKSYLRVALDSGGRTSLDDVMEQFGIGRADLEQPK